MSDHSKVDPVASGRSYTVTTANDRVPERLLDFVSHPVLTATVASRDQVVDICGSARLAGNSVVVHEKDDEGVGKDVRTWQIQPQNGQFEARQTIV